MSAKDSKQDDLSAEVAELQKLDLDDILAQSTSRRRSTSDSTASQRKKPKHEKPDWVTAWNKQHASHGEVREVVKTTETYSEADGFGSRTEQLQPVVRTTLKRDIDADAKNIWSGEESAFVEIVESAGLPDHLQLGVKHDERPSPVKWDQRPTHDGLIRKDLPLREALKELEKNPCKELKVPDEGPTKPVRKQMLRLNKVWKYRNFKKCSNCEAFDTWEARVDPYNVENVGIVHAEIWCHTCGATDFEVADNMPAHIGSWAPPKETDKERADKEKRRAYREERALYSLVQSPKTIGELLVWFRDVEGYSAVDLVMLEIMLKRMQKQGRTVRDADGKWWDREDFLFEHPAPAKPEKTKK